MFAYISKINNKDIIDYTHNMIRLYYNVDDSNDNDGEYSGLTRRRNRVS